MQTSDFDYDLPEELIAQEPAAERAASRMLVLHRDTGSLEHRLISEIGDYLNPGDLLVVNNTRVIPARVFGHKTDTGGRIELLLLEPLSDNVWLVLCRASNRPGVGTRLTLAGERIQGEVITVGEEGRLEVRFACDAPLLEILEEEGETPLPPYIKRATDDGRKASDEDRYQTVYASRPGAVAAPTAGLHFTPELLAALAAKGVDRAEVTLHVGIGTFRPVSVDRVSDHCMDEERYEISEDAARKIWETRESGGRVVAVGSTSVRTLETATGEQGRICAGAGRSDIFIYPPYTFKAVDAMLTNFHLPKSTLLMMVSALAGREPIMEAYAEAIRKRYRFFSYGDCMLIL
ncbi:MAG: tRNA preQ1(34) S-adenosylmethionine ribosyltransferase-isomerase QueA [Verrucomicrobia bacterium]|jgi:S-adenosylmethionine:tRNA ribosyltransferase-isomerase|nr:tRNA preQ1(34) S-adenosylmethionine ribosyltransferase-isomerase QueA [Verrucomicrobiota bacterium]